MYSKSPGNIISSILFLFLLFSCYLLMFQFPTPSTSLTSDTHNSVVVQIVPRFYQRAQTTEVPLELYHIVRVSRLYPLGPFTKVASLLFISINPSLCVHARGITSSSLTIGLNRIILSKLAIMLLIGVLTFR